MQEGTESVVSYYQNLESRLGYLLVLGGSQHFGFHPLDRKVKEKEAQRLYHELVEKELAPRAGERILDAGCGQGVVSTFLAARHQIQIKGITVVPHEAEASRKQAERRGVSKRANYHVMDYSKTSFPDHSFDAIYTTETLSHAVDLEATLSEFQRLLIPGGRVLFFEYSLAADGDFSAYEREMLDRIIRGSAMHSLNRFRHEAFSTILRDLGFQDVEEREISSHILPSFERLHRICRAPYFFVKAFGAQESFPNAAAGVEMWKMAHKKLIHYNIHRATLPTNPLPMPSRHRRP